MEYPSSFVSISQIIFYTDKTHEAAVFDNVHFFHSFDSLEYTLNNREEMIQSKITRFMNSERALRPRDFVSSYNKKLAYKYYGTFFSVTVLCSFTKCVVAECYRLRVLKYARENEMSPSIINMLEHTDIIKCILH